MSSTFDTLTITQLREAVNVAYAAGWTPVPIPVNYAASRDACPWRLRAGNYTIECDGPAGHLTPTHQGTDANGTRATWPETNRDAYRDD